MYKIVETGPKFKHLEKEYTPLVTIENNSGTLWNILVQDDKYYIFVFDSKEQKWFIETCIFDKYFIEVLRLLPENPKDLVILNQDFYKQMLNIWQTEENFALDANLIDYNNIIDETNKIINEKKGD